MMVGKASSRRGKKGRRILIGGYHFRCGMSANLVRACADAAITGIMPPPLMELPSREHYYCAVTVGDDAVISAYRSRSLVGIILSKVVPATFSTIASFSKMIWRSERVQLKIPEVKPQPFAKDLEDANWTASSDNSMPQRE